MTTFRSPDIPEPRSVRGADQEGWNSQAIMCVPNLLP